MIELSSGDQILATIAKVDQQGVHFQSPLTSVTQLPHAWVRSVRFREVFAGPVMTREQKRRLLTVQGSRRSDPPTHLIVSNTGDTLRGNLVSLSEGVLSAEIRSRMVQLSVGQIAEIIWLFDRSSESKPMEDIHHVQIVSSGATTTLHDQVRVEHGMLIGTSRMFGDVQIPLDHLSMIAIGCEPIEDDYELNFE